MNDLLAIPGMRPEHAPRAALGIFPTPVERARDGVLLKRDDLSGAIYGGNKVRVLEAYLGTALAGGAREIVALGAWGSNHVLATALHAPRVGLKVHALMVAQPPLAEAAENVRALLMTSARVEFVPHLLATPWAFATVLRRTRGVRSMMAPGGATALGATAYANAALELAAQVERGELPAPDRIVLPLGSGCTTAGLLAGLALAKALGRWPTPLPRLESVRVAPWPAWLAPWALRRLASATLHRLGRRTDLPIFREAVTHLGRVTLIGGQLGAGYGHPTPAGAHAAKEYATAWGVRLDAVYMAKAAAHVLATRNDENTLLWVTKNQRPLADATPAVLSNSPAHVRRWLEQPFVTPR